jgi:TolB-like protein/Flp pilus assembly protein TadD
MESSKAATQRTRFGVYELDMRAAELRKNGVRLTLQEQPCRILQLLLENPGEVVTREELRKRIWPDDTFVDFDHSLYTAVTKLREVLGDSSENPRFIETLSRRGYRFIAPVEGVTASSGRRTSIAVLPFTNMNNDPEQDYFSDGLTEEMITQLGRLHPQRLGVIARSSIMKYKQTDKGANQIGRELGVDHILEGSVRRSGQRVRVTAQLIQVSDQTHLWAETYEQHRRDILVLQNKIAQAIAMEIKLKLRPEEQERLARVRTVNPEAHETYLRGLHQLRKLTREGAEKAVAHFEQAVRKDSCYALAHVGLTEAYIALTTFYLAPLEGMPKAKAAAVKAVELDDSLAEAHAALGLAKFFHDWDWAGAEREFRTALALNPSLAEAHSGYAGLLASQGREQEALVETRKAQELDPLPVYLRGEGLWHFYIFRQYDETIRQCRKAVELEPDFFFGHTVMAWALAEEGRYAEAIAAAERGRQLSGSPFALTGLGYVYAEAGDKHKANRVLQELTELSRQRYVCGYHVGMVYLALGQTERALDWLEKAYSERSD